MFALLALETRVVLIATPPQELSLTGNKSSLTDAMFSASGMALLRELDPLFVSKNPEVTSAENYTNRFKTIQSFRPPKTANLALGIWH